MPTMAVTSAYNLPGRYYLYKCVVYVPAGASAVVKSMTFCINIVEVKVDSTMQFLVRWTAAVEANNNYVQRPDLENNHLYLEDDLGNRYLHTVSGGCAAEETVFIPETSECNGWFIFPPASSQARSFRFVDSVNWFSIEKIVLLQPVQN
jgi:hypothetical protein